MVGADLVLDWALGALCRIDGRRLGLPGNLAGLEISKWERLQVANCYDVPISLLQAEDTNRAVASEGTHQHQYYAIAPRCVLTAAAMTQQLARPVDDRLFFGFDDPVKRDEEQRAKVFDMQVKNGTLTINEARKEDGREDVEWGDEPWFSQTMIQPTALADANEAKKAASQAALASLASGTVDPSSPPGDAPGVKPGGPEEDPAKRELMDRLTRALDVIERELPVKTD